jgi:hypothetical protein
LKTDADLLERFAVTLTNAMLHTEVRRAVIVSTAFLFKDSIIPPTYLFGRFFFRRCGRCLGDGADCDEERT